MASVFVKLPLQSSTTSVADALATTGSSVNVSSSAPPSTGQVLTATDSTHATWQTPASATSDDYSQSFLLMGA